MVGVSSVVLLALVVMLGLGSPSAPMSGVVAQNDPDREVIGPRRWTVHNVAEWLAVHDIGHHAPKFARASIDGAKLLSMSDADFKNTFPDMPSQDMKALISGVNMLAAARDPEKDRLQAEYDAQALAYGAALRKLLLPSLAGIMIAVWIVTSPDNTYVSKVASVSLASALLTGGSSTTRTTTRYRASVYVSLLVLFIALPCLFASALAFLVPFQDVFPASVGAVICMLLYVIFSIARATVSALRSSPPSTAPTKAASPKSSGKVTAARKSD